ncbi:MAG TPA: ABC transporter substrate-binding protein [Devosiaceae bacterium]
MAKFTRRDVNRGLLMLGLGTASGALFSAVPALAQDAVAKPKKGGTFTAVFINEPASMDPVIGNNPGNDGRSYNLFSEKLISLDFDGNFQPWLAESWEEAEDGLSMTFKLQKGVKFQDGTDFDAAAVKANLDRSRDPTPESRSAPYLTSITSVEVIDPLTVKLNLKERTGSFLSNLAAEPGQMVSPKAVAEMGADFSRKPIGTGPFQLTSWSGGKIEAQRWDGYWRKDKNGEQLPYLDKVVFNVVPAAAVQLVQMRSKGAVWGDNVLTQDYEAVGKDPNLELVQAASKNTLYTSFNNSAAPFQGNLNLRKAVSHAINREAIAKIITGQYGGPAVCIEAPGSWAIGPELKGHTYDPDLAKKAYADSGHTGPILMSIIQRDPDSQVAQLIQSMCKQVGIDVQIEVMERTAWVEKVGGGNFQMSLQSAGTPQPDPDRTFSQYYARTAAQNYSRMSDDLIFDLVDKARSESDREKRRVMYVQIQQQILDQYYQTFHYWVQRFAMRNKSVKGMKIERGNSFILDETWIDA